MDANGQLHAPAALYPEKEPLLPMRKNPFYAPAGKNTGRPARSLISILNELPWFPFSLYITQHVKIEAGGISAVCPPLLPTLF